MNALPDRVRFATTTARGRVVLGLAALALCAGTTTAVVSASAPPPATATVAFSTASTAAPLVSDPSSTGARLAKRFLRLLEAHDVDRLKRFLAPNFQVQRADGSGATKKGYLKSLPTITDFAVSGAVGTVAGDTLVVRYLADVTGVANGKEYTAGNAPRISSFRWNGHRWQMTSHANFNPLQAESTTPGVQVLLDRAMTTVLGQPLAYPKKTPAQLSSSILTLAPGAETGWHYHEAPLYAYVMSGSIRVTYDGGIVKTYRAGEAIVEAIGTHHNGQNVGSVDAVLVVVNIGAEGVQNTVHL